MFNNASHEKAFLLWANCTLGLMCHWWHANKQQSGRGSITITAIPNVAIYDFSQLSSEQLQKAEAAFEEFATKPLRPFNEIDADPARHELDRITLIDVFGLPPRLVASGGHIELLRCKLAREPSIRGGKRNAT